MKTIVASAVLTLAIFCLAGGDAAAQGGNTFINGLAPDWNQPLDYPDAFDGTGPGGWAQDVLWKAWCVPSTGAGLVGYWEDNMNRLGLADGSADGNQDKIPPGYQGPLYGAGPSWHDYTADGNANNPGGGAAARGARAVEDHGWYMDTNGAGVNGFVHAGTFYKDVAPGLNAFFGAIGTAGGQPAQNMIANTLGVNAFFGGHNVQALIGFVKGDIDNGRPVVAHFTHWGLIQQSTAQPGTGDEDDEEDFDVEEYIFDSHNPGHGGHDEPWNGDTGPDGLGHSVLVVGYTTNAQNQVTHFIMHDNWPTTARNVTVPVGGGQLAAITTVKAFNLVAWPVPFLPGHNGDFHISGGMGSSPTWLVYSLYGPGYRPVPILNVVLDLNNPDLLVPMKKTDSGGNVSWSVPVPYGASGLLVWFQAIQFGQTTNVVANPIL